MAAPLYQQVSLTSNALLDTLNVTAVAADPYAPSCEGESSIPRATDALHRRMIVKHKDTLSLGTLKRERSPTLDASGFPKGTPRVVYNCASENVPLTDTVLWVPCIFVYKS